MWNVFFISQFHISYSNINEISYFKDFANCIQKHAFWVAARRWLYKEAETRGNKMPTRCNRWFLLLILLLAQHVSGTNMSIIRSSRILYRWLLPVVFGFQVVGMVWSWGLCNPQLHTIPTTWKPKHQIPQAATTCIIFSSSWWWS